jgi:hypothetical protein
LLIGITDLLRNITEFEKRVREPDHRSQRRFEAQVVLGNCFSTGSIVRDRSRENGLRQAMSEVGESRSRGNETKRRKHVAAPGENVPILNTAYREDLRRI